jgi:hypothetical protein
VYQGSNGNVSWLESGDLGLSKVIAKCPEIFAGRAVAITAFDSGSLAPSAEERALGWYAMGGVCYVPRVIDPQQLPHDQFDEWFIFDRLKEFTREEPFVNDGSFALRDPAYLLEEADPTWDKVGIREDIQRRRSTQERFWAYVAQIGPRAFILDGDRFLFGSRVPADVQLVKSRLGNTDGAGG